MRRDPKREKRGKSVVYWAGRQGRAPVGVTALPTRPAHRRILGALCCLTHACVAEQNRGSALQRAVGHMKCCGLWEHCRANLHGASVPRLDPGRGSPGHVSVQRPWSLPHHRSYHASMHGAAKSVSFEKNNQYHI